MSVSSLLTTNAQKHVEFRAKQKEKKTATIKIAFHYFLSLSGSLCLSLSELFFGPIACIAVIKATNTIEMDKLKLWENITHLSNSHTYKR